MKASEVLRKAADRVEPEGRWTQGAAARTANGSGVCWDNQTAVCWCTVGAFTLEADQDDALDTSVRGYIKRAIGMNEFGHISLWNDQPSRTQSEVVAALRKAAELAEAEGM